MRGRIATAPDGVRWRVGRRWLNRPMPKPRWRRKRTRDDDGELPGGWLPDAVLTGMDGLGGFAFVVGALVAIAVFVFVLLPLIGIAFELALVIGVATAGLFGRVVLRRPWTIEAVSLDDPARRHAFAVVGWRRSRRALAELGTAIATAGPPAALLEAEPIALNPAESPT
ncbi:MAG: hypothetical protein ACJ76L_04940 [Conexibacter sp.]